MALRCEPPSIAMSPLLRPGEIVETSSIQRIADELEILRLLAKFSQSVDDLNEGAYLDCLADLVSHPSTPLLDNGEWRSVSSVEYARRAIAAACAMDWTHHQMSNIIIALDGLHATGTADMVVEMQSTDETGRETRLTVGGRCELGFTRVATGWRIDRRGMERRYILGDSDLLQRSKQIRKPR